MDQQQPLCQQYLEWCMKFRSGASLDYRFLACLQELGVDNIHSLRALYFDMPRLGILKTKVSNKNWIEFLEAGYLSPGIIAPARELPSTSVPCGTTMVAVPALAVASATAMIEESAAAQQGDGRTIPAPLAPAAPVEQDRRTRSAPPAQDATAEPNGQRTLPAPPAPAAPVEPDRRSLSAPPAPAAPAEPDGQRTLPAPPAQAAPAERDGQRTLPAPPAQAAPAEPDGQRTLSVLPAPAAPPEPDRRALPVPPGPTAPPEPDRRTLPVPPGPAASDVHQNGSVSNPPPPPRMPPPLMTIHQYGESRLSSQAIGTSATTLSDVTSPAPSIHALDNAKSATTSVDTGNGTNPAPDQNYRMTSSTVNAVPSGDRATSSLIAPAMPTYISIATEDGNSSVFADNHDRRNYRRNRRREQQSYDDRGWEERSVDLDRSLPTKRARGRLSRSRSWESAYESSHDYRMPSGRGRQADVHRNGYEEDGFREDHIRDRVGSESRTSGYARWAADYPRAPDERALDRSYADDRNDEFEEGEIRPSRRQRF